MDLAGFTYNDAEVLRKAAGKKDTEKMAKVKTMFLDGSKKIDILDEESAAKIWAQMEASQRYAFNKCVSYDTVIRRASTNKKNLILTVEEMYKIKNDIKYAKKSGHLSLYKKWKFTGNYGKGLSLCSDGRVRPNDIVNITPAGNREIYRITLDNQSYIDVTDNHKFPTNRGILLCNELKIGDELYHVLPYEGTNKKYGWSNISIPELRNIAKNRKHDHITAGFLEGENNPGYVNGEYTKFIENANKLPNHCDICHNSNIRLETHHKDGNRQNNNISNLQKLCVSHHKKEEYKLGRLKRGEKGYPTQLIKIISIEKINEGMTYNVEMDGPNHNFVTSQNIVTCNSHSASYGIYTFATAWFKAHFPLEFFCSYLGSAKEKSDPIEEMHELVNECKLLDIEVLPPDFRWQEANFHIKDNKIYFGMGNVKGIGQSKIKKLFNLCQDTPVEELDWFSLLLNVFSGLDITIVENLILVGAFDYLKIPRIRMHYEYGVWNRLTEKEQDWIKTTSTQNSILEAIREAAKPRKEGGACANKNRIAELEDLIKILEHPPFALKDSTGKIAIDEQRLLGISLTAHETDSGSSEATCSCKEFLGGFSGNIVLAVTITRMNEYKTKKGKNPGQAMAFLTVEDISCALDSLVVFPEVYAEFKSLLVKDNTVLIYGNRSKENSLIVQKVIQI
jgi:hypothetical protein